MTALLPTAAYVRSFGSSATDVVRAGSIQTSHHTELSSIQVLLYIHGALSGSEQMRARIYTDVAYTQLLYTGSWMSLSSISNISTSWWGWFRLDLNREQINDADVYYVALETQNYVPGAADSTYISVSLDWPLEQNTNSTPAVPALAMQIYGYRSM